ncbi:ribosomal L7Ae/L30e/S12e/Gadd45 family protein [Tepidimicrobium xylanilyticum]|uniref:Large subunit ribosomal protein L7A n=1 Tax=Tepidimicrobium xylanilyticum TaxID=1123352 RepID=A0A1H3EWA6_9FIRM|nr:ribosomal L7Ae/L30e/S12e/Gadd45 family protein [Tepidimicrobium xylanilyticum]GMG98126.1 putative ribosomal protein L7Ae-like [Tepidimicrobium xylanilyticum]SDX82209.1 large subunit ribosomal protein L7A [Tepidimicrobium xylanilyticum]
MIPELNTDKKVVGTKQVKRALLNGKAKTVYLAKDADSKIQNEIITACEEKKVPIIYVETMEELGKSCKIEVNAASAALLK